MNNIIIIFQICWEPFVYARKIYGKNFIQNTEYKNSPKKSGHGWVCTVACNGFYVSQIFEGFSTPVEWNTAPDLQYEKKTYKNNEKMYKTCGSSL